MDVKTSTRVISLGAGIWSWKNDTHFKTLVCRESVLMHVSDTNLGICALHSLKSLSGRHAHFTFSVETLSEQQFLPHL